MRHASIKPFFFFLSPSFFNFITRVYFNNNVAVMFPFNDSISALGCGKKGNKKKEETDTWPLTSLKIWPGRIVNWVMNRCAFPRLHLKLSRSREKLSGKIAEMFQVIAIRSMDSMQLKFIAAQADQMREVQQSRSWKLLSVNGVCGNEARCRHQLKI